MPIKKVKMKRSEIKRDRFIDYTLNIFSDVKGNWKKYFIILSVLILVALSAVYITKSYKQRSADGMMKLSEAIDMLYGGNQKESVELLNQIKGTYFGTVASKKAIYYLAVGNLLLGNYDEAISDYKSFIRAKAGIDDLRAAAYVGLGKCFESKGMPDSSIAYYKTAAEKYSKTIYAPEAYISMGRMYESKYDINNAVDCYEKVIYLYPESDYKKIAVTYKAMLEGAIDPLTQMQNEKKLSGSEKISINPDSIK